MRKNIRKIPGNVSARLATLNDEIRVETVIEIPEDRVEEMFGRMGLLLKEGSLSLPVSYCPKLSDGRCSKKNVEGYTITRKDLPKVLRTIYCGERHQFGDTDRPTFSLNISKKVYQKEQIGPRNNVILIELLKDYSKNGKRMYVVKFTVDEVMSRNGIEFENTLLFNLNLLQENVGQIDVFNSNTPMADYLRTVNVAWEILPPGNGDSNLIEIMRGIKKLDESEKRDIQDRYEFLNSLNPVALIKGVSGMNRYFGFKFSEELVVLENLEYGNALYVLFENWETLSKLSRTELFARGQKDFERIVHNKNYWKSQLKQLIKSRLN